MLSLPVAPRVLVSFWAERGFLFRICFASGLGEVAGICRRPSDLGLCAQKSGPGFHVAKRGRRVASVFSDAGRL